MKYSFISPRKKRVISGELRLAFLFFLVSILMIVGTYFFLSYKTYQFAYQHEHLASTLEHFEREARRVEQEITYLEEEVKEHEAIATRNTLKKDRIRNLFDLVPDKITLSRAEIGETSLILEGITPSKEVYEYMLHAPLRSIFHRTYTSYYPAQNGWVRFVSSNYLDDESPVEVIE